jgi:hypothetical protein
MSLPRPLSDRERGVLNALLAMDFSCVEALREQARTVLVHGLCDCGCPTIHFSAGSGPHVLVADATSDEGQDVLLFAGDHGLDSLESSWTTDRQPTAFPPPDSLIVRAR